MKYNNLGKSGLKVSALSFGSWITFGDQIGNNVAERLMDMAYDAGVNFFDNAEGNITHVGIIMEDNYIIHAHGKVRIDRLDHSGIYNVDKNEHTHVLHVGERDACITDRIK